MRNTHQLTLVPALLQQDWGSTLPILSTVTPHILMHDATPDWHKTACSGPTHSHSRTPALNNRNIGALSAACTGLL